MLSVQSYVILALTLYLIWGRVWLYGPLLVALVGLMTFVYWISKIKDWYQHVDPKIPRAPNEGLLGSIGNWDSRHYLLGMIECSRRLDKVFATRVVDHVDVVVADASVALQVMQATVEKPPFVRTVLSPLIGWNSLTSAVGNDWKLQRSILQRAFHTTNTPRFSDLINKLTLPLIETLTKLPCDATVELDHEFVCLTVKIIAEAMFSCTWENLGGQKIVAELVALIDSMCLILSKPWMKLHPLIYWQRQKSSNALRSHFRSILEERRANPDKKTALDMVDVMLSDKEEGQGLSDESIIDQIMLFFFAGHDTTAHTLAWAVHHISQRPDVEAKMVEEIMRVNKGDPNANLTASDVVNLTYTTCVIRETLRMRPPISLFARYTTDDLTVGPYTKKNGETVGPLLIKKGTNVDVLSLAIHHDESVYPDPYRFDPDRWLGKTADHTWLPFAYLSRSCIGREFAMLELRIVLAMLYSRFTFRGDTQRMVGPASLITTKPADGIHVYVKTRAV